jgi:membrane protease subunit (stomatin/prohibitin family)
MFQQAGAQTAAAPQTGGGDLRGNPAAAPAAAAATASVVTCPACQKTVAPGKFCAECGTVLPAGPKFCSGCGAKLADGAKFCPECGAKAGA